MWEVLNMHTHSEGLDAVSPSRISKKWRRIWNQIRWRVSALVAAKHGKKKLLPWTAERLRSEILERCRILEEQKKQYENPPEQYKEIIKAFGRKESLFKNRNSRGRYKSYNESAINELLTITNSTEEIKFIETFLRICWVRKEVFESILIRPIFTRDFN